MDIWNGRERYCIQLEIGEGTLLPIIQRHVEVGSTIYSDGWSFYCSLNDIGYEHFTVTHKYTFKKTYINAKTRQEVENVRKINQFDGHLAEIIWRSVVKSFFGLVKCVYPLDKPATYMYKTPLFDPWACLPYSQVI